VPENLLPECVHAASGRKRRASAVEAPLKTH
jgi:hypothetical protein